MRILIAIIIVIAIIAGAFYVFQSSSYQETNISGGTWGETITVEYEDGTEEQIFPSAVEPLAYYHGGKPISEIHYKLCAKSSSAVSGTVYIDMRSCTVTFTSYKKEGGSWSQKTVKSMTGSSYGITPNGLWQTVNTFSQRPIYLGMSGSPGDWKVVISLSGSISWSWTGSSAGYQTIGLPGGGTVYITVT